MKKKNKLIFKLDELMQDYAADLSKLVDKFNSQAKSINNNFRMIIDDIRSVRGKVDDDSARIDRLFARLGEAETYILVVEDRIVAIEGKAELVKRILIDKTECPEGECCNY